MKFDAAFAPLKNAFPESADFQGVHFRFAARNGAVLIEKKHQGHFFYWLLVQGRFLLIDAAPRTKLAPMRTIGDSFPNMLDGQ